MNPATGITTTMTVEVRPGDCDPTGNACLARYQRWLEAASTHAVCSFGYWFFAGTSMAAPHVAALAALVKSENPALTAAEIRQALRDTADPSVTDDCGFGLVDATRLLPAAVLAVTFPALCRARDRELVARLSGRLTAAGGVLGALTASAAPWLVVWAYGEPFRAAATTLSILAIAIPLFFLNYALTHQVIGWDGQRAYLAIAALALAVNVLANVSLVPSLAANGAAAATVLTEIVVTLGCAFVLRSGAWVPAAPRASEGGR